MTDRVFRPIRALLAGAVAIGMNTTLLAGADELGLKTAHGGLLRLLECVGDGIAARLSQAAWRDTAILPLVSSAHFEFFFHVFVGLLIAVFYAYVVEPALIGRPWAKGLICAVAVWMLNRRVAVDWRRPRGIAPSGRRRHDWLRGGAHHLFVLLAVLYAPLPP